LFLFSAARIKLYVWLSLASQILIVVTGGAVRLTASGLGCPTWPKCTDDSLTNVPEQGIHGFIEFANRLLTFVLIIIALLTFIAIWRSGKVNRRGMVWPSLSLGLGIFAQAIVGGISVLTNLNPWVVGLHFIVSTILISIASILVWRFYKPEHQPIPYSVYRLTPLIAISGFVALAVGVVVTGAGPHAGDANAPRNNLDLEVIQHLHSYPGYISIGLTLLAVILLLRVNKHSAVSRATRITLGLLAALAVQALIGIIQARTGVPAILVGLHMLGASVISSLITFQWLSVRGK
jgi:cytochrome c oxidase assembly protein subunit 15